MHAFQRLVLGKETFHFARAEVSRRSEILSVDISVNKKRNAEKKIMGREFL